jgi:hypothetical protein
MSEKGKAGWLQAVPWPAVAMLVGSLGIFAPRAPLETLRPEGDDVRTPGEGATAVRSRLWDDPLAAPYAAFAEGRKAKDGDPRANAALAEVREALARAAAEAPVEGRPAALVLPVFVGGGPYPEDQEGRMRTRYAVELALSAAGYAPEDPQHLAYFVWRGGGGAATAAYDVVKPWEQTAAPAASAPTEAVVPFEWFAREGRGAAPPGAPRRVLVQWIDEVYFRERPLTTLAAVQKDLLGDAIKGGVWPDSLRFAVVGPTTSSTLIRMVGEALAPGARARLGVPAGKTGPVLCPSATAPDAEIAAAFDRTPAKLFEDLAQAGVLLDRVIAPDDLPARLLLKELALRRAAPDERRRMAIVGEWDSAYGRAWAATLRREILAASPAVDPERVVTLVPFLKGVDGRVRGAKVATAAAEPHGRAQTDYLRRLESALAETDARLRAEPGGPFVASVGVFGADVYDKLVVLRALHRAVPKAVFFTSDLDARLWAPGETEFTRNLVVASQFGLEPADEGAPATWAPFRDHYQTATFRAVAAALDPAASRSYAREKQGRLFEIGRDGPVELRSSATPNAPGVARALVNYGTVAAVAFILLCLMAVPPLGAALAKVGRRGTDSGRGEVGDVRRNRLGSAAAYAWAAAAATLAAVAWWDARRPDGEPFSLTDGVSAWPATLFGVVAGGLALWCLARGATALRRDARDCEAEFGFASDAAGKSGRPRGVLARIKAAFAAPAPESPDVEGHWRAYRRGSGLERRGVRVACMTAAYLTATMAMIGAQGWNTEPARGDVARTAYFVGQGIGIGCFVLLVAAVFDATGRSSRFLRALAPEGAAGAWPRFPARARADDDATAVREAELRIAFVARHSGAVGDLAYAPFFVLLLLVASRTRFAENWEWTPAIVACAGTHLLFLWICGVHLRLTAAGVRHRTIAALRARLPSRTAPEGEFARAAPLRDAIKRIEDQSGGAFRPWHQDPVFGAILIPFGGTGALGLAELLLR